VVRNAKISQNYLVIMGDLPRWKMKRFFKEVWLWWVTYPGKNEMSWRYDRARRRTIQETRAQRSIQKEIGLEGEQGLKSALERR
jgi:hypothetical protein